MVTSRAASKFSDDATKRDLTAPSYRFFCSESLTSFLEVGQTSNIIIILHLLRYFNTCKSILFLLSLSYLAQLAWSAANSHVQLRLWEKCYQSLMYFYQYYNTIMWKKKLIKNCNCQNARNVAYRAIY